MNQNDLQPIIEDLSESLDKIKGETKESELPAPTTGPTTGQVPVSKSDKVPVPPTNKVPVPKSAPIPAPPLEPLNDIELKNIMLQCKNNIKNKNTFIDLFMNHFLNCDTIVENTQNTITNQGTLQTYFKELFLYSSQIVNQIPNYEKFTTNFETYINDPISIGLLDGFTINNSVPTTNLQKINTITQNPIFKTQQDYNHKIELNIKPDTTTHSVSNNMDPFESSIYNYINKYVVKPRDILKLKKFDIVNSIINLDQGILMEGGGGASSNRVAVIPVKPPDTKTNPPSNPTDKTNPPAKIKPVIPTFEKFDVPPQTDKRPLDIMKTKEIHDNKDITPNKLTSDINKYYIYITDRDINRIIQFTKQYPNLETGGDLWGYVNYVTNTKLNIYDTVIKVITGPGQGCNKQPKSFNQSGPYLENVGQKLATLGTEYGHIGDWHSHHNLTLTTPSAGDTNTIHRAMETYKRGSFPCFITNIVNGEVIINAYIYIKQQDGKINLYKAEIRQVNSSIPPNDKFFPDVYVTQKLIELSEPPPK